MPKSNAGKNKNAQKSGNQLSIVIVIVVLVLALALIVFAAFQLLSGDGAEVSNGTASVASQTESSASSGRPKREYADDPFDDYKDNCDYVQIVMDDGGVILLELYPEYAPKTVANFKKLVSEGFYDGLTFHRVHSGFMIQGGDPLGNSQGGPGYTIEGEFTANGVDNPLKHTRGVISMARGATDFNSAGSQFFIMHADASYLDGQYAAFGRVVSGMAVVDAVAEERVNYETPLRKIVMEKLTIVREAKSGD